MNKQEFITKKMKVLVGDENYTKSQAYAIANAYYEKEYAQMGGYQMNPSMFTMPNMNNLIQGQTMSPQQNFSAIQPTQTLLPQQPTKTFSPGNFNEWDKDNNGVPDAIQKQNNNPLNTEQSTPTTGIEIAQETNKRYNIINPYGGYDPQTMAIASGQFFGRGNTAGGVVAGAGALLGTARNFLSGFASGKESDRVKNEYFDNIFNPEINYEYAQEGGKIKNSEFLTGQYLADEGQGSVNLEHGEYVQRANTGQVQQVVGEPHIRNGKKADGVDATLEEGDKVLSDYLKIPAKNVKELKERYDLSLKKGATFADAQKAFDKKLGTKKVTDELAGYIEKLGENEKVKDETTRILNESVLTKEIQEYKTKLDVLKEPQSMFFNTLFELQEKQPKRGNSTQLFDKNGKEVTESNEEVAQQGGQQGNIEELAKKHGLTPERAKELIQMQEGGEMPQNQMQKVFEAVAQMLQQGLTPEQVAEQLISMGVPQEQVPQIIQEVANQLQGQSGQEEQMEGQMSNPQEEGMEMAQQGVFFTPSKFAKQQYGNQPYIEGLSTASGDLGDYNGILERAIIQNQNLPYLGNQLLTADNTPNLGSIGDFQKAYDEYTDATIKEIDNNPYLSEEEKKNYKEIAQKQKLGISNKSGKYDAIYGEETSTRQPFMLPYLQQKDREKYGNLRFLGDAIDDNGNIKDEYKDLSDSAKKQIQESYKRQGKKALNIGLEVVKSPTEVKADAKATVDTTGLQPDPNASGITEEIRNVLPWLPQRLNMPPSSLNPMSKEQIFLPRMDAIKQTTEPYLTEQERMRNADVERVQNSGLTPSQQEALLASGLASSQIAANDAISKTENANTANQYQTDQFNLNQRSKEDITNASLRQDYQAKVFQALNNEENSWRNYYNQNYLDQNQKFKDVNNLNLVNAVNDQYQFDPSSGVRFLNNQAKEFKNPNLEEAIGALTVEQTNAFKKNVVLEGGDRYKAYLKTIGG